MTKEDNIIVPRWFLEVVEDTLRIQNNINLDLNRNTGETCQDRNIKESLNGIRKLLRGEELTGGERLENLQPSIPTNLDNAAEKYAQKEYPDEPSCGQWGTGDYEPHVDMEYPRQVAKDSFKAGVEWLAGRDKEKIEQAFFSGYNECEERMKKEFEKRAMTGEVNNAEYPTTIQLHTFDSSLKNGEKVNIIIIKQEQD